MKDSKFIIHVLDNKQENLADFQNIFDFLGEESVLFNKMRDLTDHIDSALIKEKSENLPDLFIFDKDSFEEDLEDFFLYLKKKIFFCPIIETSSSIEEFIVGETPDKPSKMILLKPIKVNQLVFLISLFKREKQFIAKVRHDQEEIFHANRLMETGTIASGIAHEINNPNTFIALNIHYLEKLFNEQSYLPEGVNSQVIKSLESISNGSSRITRIVNSLSSFIRKNRTKSYSTGPVDFLVCLEETLFFLKSYLFRINLSIQNNSKNSIVSIESTHLVQILTNIIKNSGDAINESLTEKPTINIKIENTTSDFLTCFISDNGPGIPEEIKDSILTPFFSTKGSNGVGLGLHVVSQIIASYGGNLEFYNNENRGATFFFNIPTYMGP